MHWKDVNHMLLIGKDATEVARKIFQIYSFARVGPLGEQISASSVARDLALLMGKQVET